MYVMMLSCVFIFITTNTCLCLIEIPGNDNVMNGEMITNQLGYNKVVGGSGLTLGFEGPLPTPGTLTARGKSSGKYPELDKAFHPVFTDLLKKEWPKHVLRNAELKINFKEKSETGSLNGAITFNKASFLVNPSFKTDSAPKTTIIGNMVGVNYSYEIPVQSFSSDFVVDISSEQMEGKFVGTFMHASLSVDLTVTKVKDGSCKYEGKLFILPSKSYNAIVTTEQVFKDPDLTNKIKLILNTYVLNDLTFPGSWVYDDPLNHVKKTIADKGGEVSRSAIQRDLCDLIK